MTTSVADLGDEALARTGRFVGDRWKNIQNLGTNLRKQWDTVTKGVSNEFNTTGLNPSPKVISGVNINSSSISK